MLEVRFRLGPDGREAVAMCRPQVICAYSITPQTHIVQALSAIPRRRATPQGLAQVPIDAAPTVQRVLVAGAGPSGLSAAYHLTRLGHTVTIKNRTPRPAA
jgi:NADPH-dependent 2,4-dienoyl-CoA reductase/sulfur reductase-like enzyme